MKFGFCVGDGDVGGDDKFVFCGGNIVFALTVDVLASSGVENMAAAVAAACQFGL